MTHVTTDLPITDSYESIDDAIIALTALEQTFRAQHDRRAIFATAMDEFESMFLHVLRRAR